MHLTAIQITVSSRTHRRAVEALLMASQLIYTSVQAEAKSWEDLTADDYRQMIREQVPTIKAKSLHNYEG